jgi:hypothetical protein
MRARFKLSKRSVLFVFPYLYCFLFCITIGAPGKLLASIVFIVPFAIQLFFYFKFVDIFFGLVSLFLSGWFFLAYVSDVYKITSYNNRAMQLICFGSAIVLLNFLVTFMFFRNASLRLEKSSAKWLAS